MNGKSDMQGPESGLKQEHGVTASGPDWTGCGFLDVNSRHPELYGDVILLRDDDGIGFAFDRRLKHLIGKYVNITITLAPAALQRKRYWGTDEEKASMVATHTASRENTQAANAPTNKRSEESK